MPNVLVVDDEPSIAWALAQLGKSLGHQVVQAASAEEGIKAARITKPDVVMLDVRLPGMDGLTAMRALREIIGDVPIIIMTAHGDLNTAVEAVRQGAFEYLVKPFDLKVAERGLRQALASGSEEASDPEPSAEAKPVGELVGQSPLMQEVFKRIALVAPSLACVHLHGESGTGKELVARAIHRYSRRANGPFLAVNLAALSPALAESELFGHVQGAFTGADRARDGLLKRADQGTIFLDEVADVPPVLQDKLLRALEEREVTPVGGSRAVRSDFRVISATHRNLRKEVDAGKFREDLLFRLSTFQIDLPPLRERPEDVEELANHFLLVLAEKNQCPRPTLSDEALAEMKLRPWRGNVR
ncbi:MAG: sigma-54 dependent transcriptional regulator, partial [Planctomycetales bacterium]